MFLALVSGHVPIVSPLFSQLPLQLLLIIVGVLFFVAGYVIAVGLFVVNVPTLGLVLLLSSLAEQLFTILVTRYKKEWELKFEAQVMDCLELEYVEDEDDKETLKATSKDRFGNVTKVVHRKKSNIRGCKGCVARVCTLVKRDIVKQFNRASLKTHGLAFALVSPVTTANDEGQRKYEKRNIKGSEFTEEKHIKKKRFVHIFNSVAHTYDVQKYYLFTL